VGLSKKTTDKSISAWTVAQLGEFYSQNRKGLHNYASRILSDKGLADEVVQDALVKVLLASPELESPSHALAYMRRTIENLCIDIFRRDGRRPHLVALDHLTADMEGFWDSKEDHAEMIIAAQDAAIIRDALSLLSHSERAALVMWELDGRSTNEIARELGIKESSVRYTLSRARSSLRRILSELVIDEATGATALDLLSKTYKKTLEVSRKSSRAVLSLLLILVGFLGFNSLTSSESDFAGTKFPDTPIFELPSTTLEDGSLNIGASNPRNSTVGKDVKPLKEKSKKVWFQGLDMKGVPTGFSIADSSGGFGSAYFTERNSIASEAELAIGHIIKTDTGASNVFISQTISMDSGGLTYQPVVSFGHEERWIPLNARVSSTEIVRQANGNYLLTAYIAVDSPIETPIRIVATANGRDLDVAPSRIITRLVLDPSKAMVISQAVYVVERDPGV